LLTVKLAPMQYHETAEAGEEVKKPELKKDE
jgi:hypothetical protein